MTSGPTILVTAATGNVGGEVVSLVAEAGGVRALVRDPASAMLPDGIEMVRGDLRDPAGCTRRSTGLIVSSWSGRWEVASWHRR